eukprot:gene8326-9219_t
MVRWFCSSALCFNNHSSLNDKGKPIKFYRLPRKPEIQAEYRKNLKTSGFNWKNGHICADNWENGLRKDTNDLPNVAVPSSQVERHRIKYENALRVVNAATNVSAKQRETLKKVKKKYELAMKIASASSRARPERRVLPEQNNGQEASSSTSNFNVGNNNTTLQQHEHHEAQAIADLEKRLKELQDSLKVTEEEKRLTVTQFDLIFTCVEPYIQLIPYPHSKGSGQGSVDTKTELVTVLTICRHSLHFGAMAIMLHKSRITVQRIFTAWVIFLATLFNQVDLKPCGKFLLQKMPKIFKETGHGETDLIVDATEFKFQSASNFELNSLMFSNYKNTVTGKALIGIAPHGMGILFSEIYPGSISDSEITEKAGALNFVEEEHEIMSDRGFSIQDLCAIKGVALNRPKQKDCDQFLQKDVASNFDIAATRIHVERFIGRVRNWTILNKVWPLKQIDLLSSTWQMLCHVVNLTMAPIGPKY